MRFYLPRRIRLDICTLCQLNCTDCYMRRSNYGIVKPGYLSFNIFKKFIENNPCIEEIEISNSGEIFLNPDLKKIIVFSHKKHIRLTANNGVNLNKVDDTVLETLVKYQFYSLNISIDGASNQVYQSYRRNGNIENVFQNIKKINFYKQLYKTKYPLLNWQYIIMPKTDDISEIHKAKSLAKELGMSISFKKTWSSDYIPQNKKELEKETGLKFNKNTPFSFEWKPCYELWNAPQINWDGRLLGCCTTYLKCFHINVFDIGLEKALKSPELRYAKKLLMGKTRCKKEFDIPCHGCIELLKMQKSKQFMDEKNIVQRKK